MWDQIKKPQFNVCDIKAIQSIIHNQYSFVCVCLFFTLFNCVLTISSWVKFLLYQSQIKFGVKMIGIRVRDWGLRLGYWNLGIENLVLGLEIWEFDMGWR